MLVPHLIFFLFFIDNRNSLSVASPPQLFSPGSVGQPSVITRLPRPPLGSPYGPGGKFKSIFSISQPTLSFNIRSHTTTFLSTATRPASSQYSTKYKNTLFTTWSSSTANVLTNACIKWGSSHKSLCSIGTNEQTITISFGPFQVLLF